MKQFLLLFLLVLIFGQERTVAEGIPHLWKRQVQDVNVKQAQEILSQLATDLSAFIDRLQTVMDIGQNFMKSLHEAQRTAISAGSSSYYVISQLKQLGIEPRPTPSSPQSNVAYNASATNNRVPAEQ